MRWPGAASSSGASASACTRMSGTQSTGSLAAKPGRSTTIISRSPGRAASAGAQYSAHEGAPVMTTIFHGAGLSRGVASAEIRQPRPPPAWKLTRRTTVSG